MTIKMTFPLAFAAIALLNASPVRSAPAPDGAETRLGEFSISEHVCGPEVDIKKAGAKLTVLYFWGMRCSPCVQTLPKLAKLQRAYRDKGLVIVGIHAASGDIGDIRAACRKHAVTFAVYRNYKTPKKHAPGRLPHVLMFDENGELVFNGHYSLISKEIEARFGEKAIGLADRADGAFVLDAGKLAPDEQGVLAKFDLALPAFKRAAYYQGGWWPAGGNRVYSHLLTPAGGGMVDIREVNEKVGPEGGLFAVFEKTDGRYLALLPLAGDHTWAGAAGIACAWRSPRRAWWTLSRASPHRRCRSAGR